MFYHTHKLSEYSIIGLIEFDGFLFRNVLATKR